MREISLKDYRKEIGLTVHQLADQLGVSPIELMVWERNESDCPFPRMLELAVEMIAIQAEAPEMEKAIAASEAFLNESNR